MGNLEVSGESRIMQRRPIFEQKCYNQCSRSLSSCRLRTARNNMNKSMINGDRNYDRNRCVQNNKVYISSRMIKSVIKDNNEQNRNRNRKDVKNYKNNPYFLMSRSVLGARRRDQNMNVSYHQRSVNKNIGDRNRMQNCIKSSIMLRQCLQKQMKENRIRGNQKNNLIENMDQFVHSYNKSPLKFNNFMKSGNNSGKIGIIQDKRYFQDLKNENNFIWKGVHHGNEQILEQGFIMDNTLTERKKPVRLFDSTVNKLLDKNKKMRSYQDSTQTFGNEKQNINNPVLIHQENRQKCQEIIKRVRNFNEFLNEVKLKLKKQTQIASSQNNTMSSMSIDQSRQYNNNNSINTSVDHTNSIGSQFMQTHNKSISLALKLENQKIELQKYKKLVERELSKQHSIESIEIQGGRNKEKIITINFQGKLNQDKFKPIQIYPNNGNAKQDFLKIETIKEEDSTKQSFLKESKIISQRVNNITKLMNKMEGINKEQSQNYCKISEFLRSEECQNDDDQ